MITCIAHAADMQLASYRFDLPPEQIAQFPPERRGNSKLMCLPLAGGPARHEQFASLPDLLPPGTLLVANNSRVLQARLQGTRATGGKVEFLLLTPLPLLLAASENHGPGSHSAPAEGPPFHTGPLQTRYLSVLYLLCLRNSPGLRPGL